jgi:dihydrofolate synthase/folylpolyglutamate synthase
MVMNYEETLSYLYDLERFGIKLDLSNITSILRRLGNPHQSFPSVHIAGTNGKGSVAAMLHSILYQAGYRVGMYTSPHLVDFRERIKVGPEFVDQDFVVDLVLKLKDDIDQRGYTFFEVTTAMAFEHFARKQVDLGVVETGLGGRLDATNMITPLVSIITNIGKEHTQQLGDVIAQIATEKAGIVKRAVPTITAVSQPEALDAIRVVCAQRKSEFIRVQNGSVYSVLDSSIHGSRFNFSSNSFEYRNLELNLAGEHQLQNALTALTTIQELVGLGWKVDEPAIRKGLKQVNWRARLEVFGKEPRVLLDVAHNPRGMQTLVEALEQLFPERKVIFVFGVMGDKDYRSMLETISRKARLVVLTKPDYKRAVDPEVLREVIMPSGIPCRIVPQVEQAYHSALEQACPDDVVCITGSHFTVGELLGSLESH